MGSGAARDALLERARELVRAGWIQGRLVVPETREVCLVGAICQAGIEAEVGLEVVAAYRVVAEAALLLDGHRDESAIDALMRWNDASTRTREDVLHLLSLARSLVSLYDDEGAPVPATT